MRNILLLGLALSFASCVNQGSGNQNQNPNDQQAGWEILFNGQDLSNWEILGSDSAKFMAQDSMIIGEAQKGIPNSFLSTKKHYEDFELEVEFMVDPELNSGINIRSGVYEEETKTQYLAGDLNMRERTWGKGKVYGYQVEIDPSKRAWSGGFYEEGGRGWLQPLTENEAARNAYNQQGWNKFRIVANDNHFQTWLNGVKSTDIYDSQKRSGSIGLQLHSVSRDDQVGKKVRFKNIRIRELP